MKPVFAIGRIYVTGNKVQIYVMTDFANQLLDKNHFPCQMLIMIPENEDERTQLEVIISKLRKRT